ncbi:bifunctional glutamate N-acetyltransferase/amino-acid acetyltransferase ArgJ [Micromonospora sp. FIMYZ51]|uniref:bifunctional glutamate N-acetyltransferase/amino-acid acetyltransferase ArgJ n=1 Tax=Micromonospora sp. FIMYZ51 TaxID=3051832 RepID=UPI00311DC14F
MSDPRGFRSVVTNAGLRADGDDFAVLVSAAPATCAAVFTRSRLAGPSVELSRSALRAAAPQGVIVASGNANVATGQEGLANARETRDLVADALGIPAEELLIASTGSIARQYPMPTMRKRLAALPSSFPPADFHRISRAILTKDTRPKIVHRRCGSASIVGFAKGIGMIEPDMATMLAFFATDALLPADALDRIFRQVVSSTFNAVSVDSDTSPSDTAAVFANGLAGPVDEAEFTSVLHDAALALTRMIARDGEGATKLIEARVGGARDTAQATRVGKAIINSPRVKTAVHGGDPNSGRVLAAIGTCVDDTDIHADRVRLSFGGVPVHPGGVAAPHRTALTDHLRGDHVVIGVDLGIADGAFTVYGCDLSAAYVTVNAR